MSNTAAVTTSTPAKLQPLLRLTIGVLIALCTAKLLLHLFTSVRHYGIFRDELYYLDMARHLDWGYVDAAPLIGVYTRFAMLLGGSLAALRILPALAGTALIALSVLIAREFGGGRFAQFLAGLSILMAPGFLVDDSLLTMNAFEPLYWMGCIWVIARIIRTGNSRLWIWFGVLAGLGLENKHSTLFFGFAVFLSLLLTQYRREFLKPWIWIAAAIVVVLFLPNLLWQVHRHFPTLEDLENVRREGKNVVLPLLPFIKEQFIGMHPVLSLVWLAGLVWLLMQKSWRVFGVAFLVFFSSMFIEHAKDYYLFSMYPMLFAAGGVVIERRLAPRPAWTRAAVVIIILALTIPTVPLATWMLSPEQYVAYTHKLGFEPPKQEVHHAGMLPQPMGDQFGWTELAHQVADIYNSLPPDERAKTGILAGNYGEAGAINEYGPQYGLPRAYSRHQNHWFWGPPQQDYRNFIFLQFSRNDVQENCASWQAFEHFNKYGMAEENTPIYLCLGATFDLRKIWWRYHHWN